jgi:hypothetical protein
LVAAELKDRLIVFRLDVAPELTWSALTVAVENPGAETVSVYVGAWDREREENQSRGITSNEHKLFTPDTRVPVCRPGETAL